MMRDARSEQDCSSGGEGFCASPETFEQFLSEHYDRIFAYAWRVLGNHADAEDLTQEVCLALPRKLAGYRGDCAPTTWLYRIVSNAAIDMLRRNAAVGRSKGAWADSLTLAAADGQKRTRDSQWLSQAMSTLPEDLRVTVALLVDADMSQAEAAQALDVAPGTIAWRMSEIKKRLKAVAKEECHD